MSRYENYAIKNNVFGTLSAPISSLATTIQLNSGQGARFSTNQLATLEHIENNKVKKREIVKITNISGDNLTVVRKFAPCPIDDDANTQSQTSFSFDTSDTISVYITAEHFDNIENGFTNAEAELDGLNYDGNARMKVIKAISGTALKIDIVAGVYRCGGDTLQFAGQTDISVNNNSTNYIMVDGAGTVQISTSSRDTRYTRLAEVVCSGGVITSISDRRSDVVGGTLGGLEIHSLTEKTSLVNDDELVIADSETSYTNKRAKTTAIIKPSFFGGGIQGFINSQNYGLGWTDNQNLIPCIGYYASSNYTYISILKDGFNRNSNGHKMFVSFPKATFQNTNAGYIYCGCGLYQGYVYAVGKIDNSTYGYIKCSADQMYDAAAWTKHTLSSSEQYMGLAGFNNGVIYVYKTNANILYGYRLSDNQLVETIDLTSINYSTYTPYMSDNIRVPYKIYGNNIYVQGANSSGNPLNLYKVNKTTLQVSDSLGAAETTYQIRFNIVDGNIYITQFYNASSAQLPWTYLGPA